jgi:hypothetical protein
MKKLFTVQHWKMFLILTGTIFLSIFISETNLKINDFGNVELSIFIRIFGIVIYFLWIMLLGLSLNNRKEAHYKFNKTLFILAVIFCLVGYSEMNIKTIYNDNYPIPITVSFLLTPLTFFGLVYTFYSISKTFKSVELQRDVSFSECILDAFLLFCFPVGIWFIQPKINKIFIN